MASSRIVELSNIIAQNTAIIDEFCSKSGIPSPSLEPHAPPMLMLPPGTPELSTAKDNIIAATRELNQLMRGPTSTSIDFIDAFALHAISRFNVATHVPTSGSIPFDSLSTLCGLGPSILHRIIRFAATIGVFREQPPNHVSHTSRSLLLAQNETHRLSTSFTFEECFPAAARAVEALSFNPEGSSEPTQSGWALANSASNPMFAELHIHHPQRARNAAVAMDMWNSSVPSRPLVHGYAWQDADLVVDIGGGHGPVSQAIAKVHPRPRFVVQDLRKVVDEGRENLPEELKGRVEFEEHDMFLPQTVEGADVYFFRSVFHDWPDEYCVEILRTLVPALKAGARVMINDACMPAPGTLGATPSREKRMWDLNMLILFNARDREEHEWKALFDRADERFRFLGARMPDKHVEGVSPTFLFAIIEAVWEP